MQYQINGIIIDASDRNDSVIWMDQWERVWDLVRQGYIKSIDRRNYGHFDFYITEQGKATSKP